MQHQVSKLLAVIVLLSGSLVAKAEIGKSYITLGFSHTMHTLSDTEVRSEIKAKDVMSTSHNGPVFKLGLRLNDNIATEFGFYTYTEQVKSAAWGKASAYPSGVISDLKYFYRLNNKRSHLYAILGTAINSVEVIISGSTVDGGNGKSATTTIQPKLGFGINHYFDETWGVELGLRTTILNHLHVKRSITVHTSLVHNL